MKIGLILPGNIWFSPYVTIYTKILNDNKIEYDLISWNRDGRDLKMGYQYDDRIDNTASRLKKLLSYIRYCSFIKKTVKRNNYDKLIVFGPQIGIFISNFLKKNYKNKYIFDYRDLSIEQNVFFKYPFIEVLKNSYVNVVSSPGFISCLPDGFDYILSHNFNIELVRQVLCDNTSITLPKDNICVLTIGGIRDYSSNIEIVKSLSNKEGFVMQFVGKGYAADLIKDYVITHNIANVEFEGYYPKEKEGGYIQNASFLNIFYPRKLSHDTALSNRFYNALIYRRPMIVTKGTTQGDYIEQYQLGLSIEDGDNLEMKIRNFLSTLNDDIFSNRCNDLLLLFMKDYNKFEGKIHDFLV